MSPSPDTRVLIVGGGLGGLTLAAILRKINIPFIVLERHEKLTPVGAAISLAPNALRVLDQIGLYESVKREGHTLEKQYIYRNEQKWRELDMTRVRSEFGYPIITLERHSFHQLLFDAAGGADTVRFGSEVEDIIDEPENAHVVVKIAGGRQLFSDVVVGADGIRSLTRRTLALKAGFKAINPVEFTGRIHLIGYTAPMPDFKIEDVGVGHWLLYDDGIFTSWPCKENRYTYTGVKRAKHGEEEAIDEKVWARSTAGMVNEALGHKFHPLGKNCKVEDMVTNSERVIATNVYQEADFPAMANGRVALLGDAAHAMTSFFGQGCCQAIEDATELANVLEWYFMTEGFQDKAGVDGGEYSVKSALAYYSTKRQPRAKCVTAFSSFFAGLHTARLPYGIGYPLRWLIYKYMPMCFWVASTRWLYSYQPIVLSLMEPSKKSQ